MIEHMPASHRRYLEWNGDRFRQWAKGIGSNTYQAIDATLNSRPVEQQSYRGCTSLLKLSDKYNTAKLEKACAKALTYTSSPSYKSIKDILINLDDDTPESAEEPLKRNPYGKPNESEQRDIFELLQKRRKKSSTIFCSQYRGEGWYEQLNGNDSPLVDAILDRSVHDSYKINIESIDPSRDISMREVYGLDKSQSE